MSCPCDTRVHPVALHIPAGLGELPRQIAGFAEFRQAMLADLRTHGALAAWRARSAGDLGLMLLEMWAALCDSVSFYDQVLAQEAYLRTSRLDISVRRLVEVLGYQPRPAVAAEVELTAVLDGNRAVTLPAGTGFRSGAFAGEAPQVFELLADASLHPWHNRYALAPAAPLTCGAAGGPGTSPTSLHLVRAGATVQAGDVVLVAASATSTSLDRARHVTTARRVEADDGGSYLRVDFDTAISLAASTPLDEITLHRATRSARLWTLPTESGSTAAIDAGLSELVLDGLNRSITAGERVVLERGDELRWFAIESVDEVQQKVKAGTDGDGNTLYGWLPATRLVLDASLDDGARSETATEWSTADAALLRVHHGLAAAGTATAPAATVLADGDALVVAGTVREGAGAPTPDRYALVDADDRSALLSGSLDPNTGVLSLDGSAEGWSEPLRAPIELRGNVLTAVRGETVTGEVLGSGDASLAGQRFVLARAPLTYHGASNSPIGVASSLRIRVAGAEWQEVPSFFGTGPGDSIYVVRTDADGVATILFGDGESGARLPTGASVVASYRFGAGAAAPPAGSIAQVVKPVARLSSVAQPADARGGADAEPAAQIRTLAPRSALVLGRAVSILDMDALAAAVPGVRAVQTTWAWQGEQQRPAVRCWVAGTPLDGAVEDRLRSMTEPTTAITSDPAQPLPSLLFVQVKIDERHVEEDVLDEVFDALGAPQTGLLRPESLGVGRPLYRSQLSSTLLEVPGALAVHFSAMLWADRAGALRWWLQDGYGASPGTGAYFDFEGGAVWLNGEVRRLG